MYNASECFAIPSPTPSCYRPAIEKLCLFPFFHQYLYLYDFRMIFYCGNRTLHFNLLLYVYSLNRELAVGLYVSTCNKGKFFSSFLLKSDRPDFSHFHCPLYPANCSCHLLKEISILRSSVSSIYACM